MRLLIALCCVLLTVLVRGESLIQPPTITFYPAENVKYFVSDVDTQEFTCTATGTQPMRYQWRIMPKNKKEWNILSSSGQFERTVRDGVLTINKPTFIDEGTYQCVAMNQWGTALSKTFRLAQAKLDAFVGLTTVRENARKGEYKSIACVNPPVGIPTSQYSWITTNNPSKNQDDTTSIRGEGYAVDPDGTLHIIQVGMQDSSGDIQQSPLFYMCSAWNSKLRASLRGSQTTLVVSEDNGPKPQRAPTIKFSTRSVRVELHMEQNITLMCVADGSPAVPRIGWKKGGRDISTIESFRGRYALEDFDRKLIVFVVKEEDEGNDYECYVKGTNVAEMMDVEVVSKPIPEKLLGDQILLHGDSRTIECEAKPIPEKLPGDQILLHGDSRTIECEGRSANKHSQVSITWLEGKQAISDATPRLKVDGSRLTITNAQKTSDIKALACQMKNDFGTKYFGFTINVIEETDITEKAVEMTNKTKDGEVKTRRIELDEKKELVERISDPILIKLRVRVKTDFLLKENLTVTWKRNNVAITSKDADSAVYLDILDNLILNTTAEQEGRLDQVVGNYSCVINNGVPAALKVLRISFVKENPPIVIPVVVTSEFPFWIIGLAIGLILLILVITLIVCLMYRNRGAIWKVDEKERAAGNNIEKELADSGFHDLGRADGPEEEKKPIDQRSMSDDDPPPGEDTASLDEYGEPDMSKFNEEGSFIDMYGQSRKRNEPTQRPSSLNYGPDDQQNLTNNVTPPPSYSPRDTHVNPSYTTDTNDTMV